MKKQNRTHLRKKRNQSTSKISRQSAGLRIEDLESRAMLSATAWQNPGNALDVNNSGGVTPADALAIINALNDNGGSFKLTPTGPVAPQATANNTPAPATATNPNGLFLDVLGTGTVTPQDALAVINALNVQPAANSTDANFILQAESTTQFTATLPFAGGTATATLNVGATTSTFTISATRWTRVSWFCLTSRITAKTTSLAAASP